MDKVELGLKLWRWYNTWAFKFGVYLHNILWIPLGWNRKTAFPYFTWAHWANMWTSIAVFIIFPIILILFFKKLIGVVK